jgi:hypothetical protein
MSALAPVRARAAAAGGARSPAHPAARSRAAVRPGLRLVTVPRAAAARLPFAILVSAILGSGLVVLLMLHTLAAQDAFTLHHLQRHAATLADTEQELTVLDQQAQAPSSLAARARSLGMVPAGSLRIVHRRDGRVVAVTVGVAPLPTVVTTTKPAAKSATAASAPPAATSSSKPAKHPRAGAHAKRRPPH